MASANDHAGVAGTIIGASTATSMTSALSGAATGSAKGSGGNTSRSAGISHRLYASRGPK